MTDERKGATVPLPLGGKLRQIMVATESRRGKWDCYSPTMAGK